LVGFKVKVFFNANAASVNKSEVVQAKLLPNISTPASNSWEEDNEERLVQRNYTACI
jgi:hypothetical protein